jgi:NADH:ubiquinone reductase (H+-translocating)
MRGKLAAVVALAGGAAGAYRLARRAKPLGSHYSRAPRKVLIVGGGFGGLSAIDELVEELDGDPGVGVALIDRVNFTTFWPMVPSAISGNVEVRHIAHSIRRRILPLGAEFFQAEATEVDFDARRVKTTEGTFAYDYLVLAPGSRTAYFDIPGAWEHSVDLKGLRDALRVRNRVIDSFEEAERLGAETPDSLLTFVFVGAGPTGVEAAADTNDLIFDVLEGDYPNVDFDRVRVIIVNSGDRILKGIDPSLAHAAQRRLASQRVEVINDVKVTEVRPDGVSLSDGRDIPARTIVWAAGINPGPLVAGLDVEKDERGRILVDEYLRVKGRPGVYSLGDCARVDYDGPPVPALAQAAEQQGRVAARNLAAEIRGEGQAGLVPFRYRPLGQLVDLGTQSALTDIMGVRISGRLGALIWRMVYLYELGHNLNRARVFMDWIVDLLTRPDTAKLYEEDI